MNSTRDLHRSALRGALAIRMRAGVSRSAPICVYDLAEVLGVEVRFVGGNSFGGMYSKTTETILVPALRPPGRQAFTCGHEMGHWHFVHGNRIEDLEVMDADNNDAPEERLANAFSSYLLAPPWAVKEAFELRQWNVEQCTAQQAYVVAVQLGLGYRTLVQHLRWSMDSISGEHAAQLLRVTPKDLRQTFLGFDHPYHLVVVDHCWGSVPIDIQVGDIALLPLDVNVEGQHVARLGARDKVVLLQGARPGISRVVLPGNGWAAYVRVSKRAFEGRSMFRHMEDDDVDTET